MDGNTRGESASRLIEFKDIYPERSNAQPDCEDGEAREFKAESEERL
ncbi:hypothetical protein LEP1GSC021_4539 [Leptospira noguchii str. 1993005606]|nr:hypothetical protein LEP1GSC021_4539 [Leptospira noguchii str. 1993005606]